MNVNTVISHFLPIDSREKVDFIMKYFFSRDMIFSKRDVFDMEDSITNKDIAKYFRSSIVEVNPRKKNKRNGNENRNPYNNWNNKLKNNHHKNKKIYLPDKSPIAISNYLCKVKVAVKDLTFGDRWVEFKWCGAQYQVDVLLSKKELNLAKESLFGLQRVCFIIKSLNTNVILIEDVVRFQGIMLDMADLANNILENTRIQNKKANASSDKQPFTIKHVQNQKEHYEYSDYTDFHDIYD